MNVVTLCGSEKDTAVADILLEAIRAVGSSTLYITAQSAALLPPDAGEADYLVFDGTGMRKMLFEKGAVLFKKGGSGLCEGDIPKTFVAIVDPDDGGAIDAVSKYGLQAVTCGLSQKATVTYSSLEQECAVVSLQREIRSLRGDTVYPREIPIHFTSARELSGDAYALLAATAALLLSGQDIPEDGLRL